MYIHDEHIYTYIYIHTKCQSVTSDVLSRKRILSWPKNRGGEIRFERMYIPEVFRIKKKLINIFRKYSRIRFFFSNLLVWLIAFSDFSLLWQRLTLLFQAQGTTRPKYLPAAAWMGHGAPNGTSCVEHILEVFRIDSGLSPPSLPILWPRTGRIMFENG